MKSWRRICIIVPARLSALDNDLAAAFEKAVAALE